MIKTIARHGNGNAIPLDKALMDQLGIGPGSLVQLVMSGGSLVITPVGRNIDEKRFVAAKAQVFEKYGRMLKRLAKK